MVRKYDRFVEPMCCVRLNTAWLDARAAQVPSCLFGAMELTTPSCSPKRSANSARVRTAKRCGKPNIERKKKEYFVSIDVPSKPSKVWRHFEAFSRSPCSRCREEQGSIHGDLCNEKIGQQRAVQSRLRGFLALSPGTNARGCYQQFIC